MENMAGNEQSKKHHISFLPSGIPGFDKVLGGGLPENGLYLIQGLAGSGKTTLACQMGFSHAKLGKKVLILTLIAESHAKLLNHLSNYTFFDESLLGNQIVFFSGYSILAKGGLRELLNFITTMLAEEKPDLLIVDGFRSVREANTAEMTLPEFMHSLNSLASSMGATTFLLSPIEGNLPGSENTLVDGIIELGQFERGMRLTRELKIYKIRGANHLLGRHIFELTEDGVVIYPRFEAVATQANNAPSASDERVSFGIQNWDEVTEGGVVRGSTTNLLGSPGIGKTLMGFHFIHQGLREKENCLIVGFYESPPRIVEKAKKVGLDFTKPLEDGSLEVIWNLPLEVLVDSLLIRLFENIERRNVKRVFIDGIEGFRDIVIHPERVRSILVALVNELRSRNITTLFTQELPYFKESLVPSDSSASVLFENMILLEHVKIEGVDSRQISVIKLRENGYNPASHVLRISNAGVSVDGPVTAEKGQKVDGK
jgi:circadian clock protein KaiC